jgi:hypothetical protein
MARKVSGRAMPRPNCYKRLSDAHRVKLRTIVATAGGVRPIARRLHIGEETIRKLMDPLGYGVRGWVTDRITKTLDEMGNEGEK